MAQPQGCGHPDVFSLKIHIQNVVVREGRGRCEFFFLPSGQVISISPWPVLFAGPVGDPGIGGVIEHAEPLIRAGPDLVAARLGSVDEIGSEAAVLGQIVVPVAAVVSAQAEIGGGPNHLGVGIPGDAGNNDVNQALVLEEDDFHLLVGVGVRLPVVAFTSYSSNPPPQMAKYILISGEAHAIGPGFMEGRVLFAPARSTRRCRCCSG